MSEQTGTSARIAGQREPVSDGGTPPVIDAAFARWLADRAGQVLLQVRAELGYADDVRRRLAVKPGMTGLWQVSGRSDLPWEEAVRLDLRYVENWSLSLDLVILLRTMTAVVRSSGAY